jgi:hypothetical protein
MHKQFVLCGWQAALKLLLSVSGGVQIIFIFTIKLTT